MNDDFFPSVIGRGYGSIGSTSKANLNTKKTVSFEDLENALNSTTLEHLVEPIIGKHKDGKYPINRHEGYFLHVRNRNGKRIFTFVGPSGEGPSYHYFDKRGYGVLKNLEVVPIVIQPLPAFVIMYNLAFGYRTAMPSGPRH